MTLATILLITLLLLAVHALLLDLDTSQTTSLHSPCLALARLSGPTDDARGESS